MTLVVMPEARVTRRELMDRAESRLRARGGAGSDEGALEASRCFLRAMLMGIDDHGPVPNDLVARVGEFLKIDVGELITPPALRRISTRPPPSNFPLQNAPGERRRRVLFLGRNDAARIAMFDAVSRASLAGDVDVRTAALTPIASDARALRVLRHAGYATDAIHPRAVTVDDLSWADLVVTVGTDREQWEKFLPRSTAHQHETIDDPIVQARTLTEGDELDAFRAVLRVIERTVGALRPPRVSRIPGPPSVR